MNQELANRLGDALIKVGNRFKAGTSEITEDEAIEIFRIVTHEAEHIKQSILDAYDVKDEGEEPAYTVGYIAMKMIEIFI